MELPIIIFVLLFILVIILILLHLSNRKYADKISILEQALKIKIDDAPALKKTYADAKQAIDGYELQESKIQQQANNIKELEESLKMLKESHMQVSAEKIEDLEKSKETLTLELEQIKKLHETEKEKVNDTTLQMEKLISEYEDREEHLKQESHVVSLQEKATQSMLDKMTEEKEVLEEKTKSLEMSVSLLREEKKSLEEKIDHLDKEVLTLKEDLHLEKEISKAIGAQKEMETNSLNREYEEVVKYMRKGHDLSDVAKHFDLSLKRIELIAKFDKIQQQK